ncbi:Alpha/Beta hydrolase protein [Aspergillus ambiguus]|uniref:alpha/beta fold hydrolase n=1 Tax=Aspergillus ambiguus TaxID=176160 RepID=UPI003CCD1A4D
MYRSRFIPTNTLSFHVLEAGYTPDNSRPLLLLLHGFPEIAFSWRKVIPKLADAGYYVVAPDQRGFGQTTGWDTRPFDAVDLSSFSLTTFVRDMVLLVHALGYRSVRCVVGHDCGAVTAAMCALVRPDLFQSLVLLSHPFNGTPGVPFNTANRPAPENDDDGHHNHVTGTNTGGTESAAGDHVHADLAARGRKHYKWYYSTAPADADMHLPADRLHDFLRGYFYLKSGSWAGNQPRPLAAWSAAELAQLPYYYVMPAGATMPEAVAAHMREESPDAVRCSHDWLSDEDLAVSVREYGRTGFQGGLNWYRVRTAAGGQYTGDFEAFAGKKIEVPCAFVSGKLDWGIYQEPGALQKMADGTVCSDFRALRLVDGVGHWAPQECPDEVVEVILDLVHYASDEADCADAKQIKKD